VAFTSSTTTSAAVLPEGKSVMAFPNLDRVVAAPAGEVVHHEVVVRGGGVDVGACARRWRCRVWRSTMVRLPTVALLYTIRDSPELHATHGAHPGPCSPLPLSSPQLMPPPHANTR